MEGNLRRQVESYSNITNSSIQISINLHLKNHQRILKTLTLPAGGIPPIPGNDTVPKSGKVTFKLASL